MVKANKRECARSSSHRLLVCTSLFVTHHAVEHQCRRRRVCSAGAAAGAGAARGDARGQRRVQRARLVNFRTHSPSLSRYANSRPPVVTLSHLMVADYVHTDQIQHCQKAQVSLIHESEMLGKAWTSSVRSACMRLGRLPAEASFGFVNEMRARSSGGASVSLLLSHWERLQARLTQEQL